MQAERSCQGEKQARRLRGVPGGPDPGLPAAAPVQAHLQCTATSEICKQLSPFPCLSFPYLLSSFLLSSSLFSSNFCLACILWNLVNTVLKMPTCFTDARIKPWTGAGLVSSSVLRTGNRASLMEDSYEESPQTPGLAFPTTITEFVSLRL